MLKRLVLVAFIAVIFSGCSNRRWYIGVDYYGETEARQETWNTKGENQNGRK